MADWFDGGNYDLFKLPYHDNRKVFQVSDFKKKKLILEIADECKYLNIVKHPKGFPKNDKFYNGFMYFDEVNMCDFLCLK